MKIGHINFSLSNSTELTNLLKSQYKSNIIIKNKKIEKSKRMRKLKGMNERQHESNRKMKW